MPNDPNADRATPSKRSSTPPVLGVAVAIVVGIVVINALLPYIIIGALLFAGAVWLEKQ